MLPAVMLSSLALWRDRRGRISVWRVAALSLLMLPPGLAARAFLLDGLGARPLNDLIHRTGFWALIFLMVTLAMTPLARIGRFGGVIDARRIMGVGTFAYAATHISLYTADQMFDLVKVVSEIVLRLYLTIGFTALVLLTLLAATSTDAMVKRLGARRWQLLHRAVYVIGILGLIHFFEQTKADVWVPTFAAGLFTWLMGYRLFARMGKQPLSAFALAGLGLLASALTFAGEAIGIGLFYHVSPLLVLRTSFDFDLNMIRPGWLVLGAGLCVVALAIVRSRKPGAMIRRNSPKLAGVSASQPQEA